MGIFGFLGGVFKKGARHAPTRQADNVAELAGKRSKKGSFRWMKDMFIKGKKWNKRAAIALALISILSTRLCKRLYIVRGACFVVKLT